MEDRQGPPERPGAQGCERPRGAVSQPLSSATQAGSFFPVGGLSMFGRTGGLAEGRWGAAQTRGHQEPGLTSPWVALSPVDWRPPHLCGL